MIDVNTLQLSTAIRERVIFAKLERDLMLVPVEEWAPICIRGNTVIDGAQRVMIARKHGIKQIPFYRFKGSA